MPNSVSTYSSQCKSLRIFITDDHALVRRGISAIISQQNDWSVIGEAGNGPDAINLVRKLQPDVVLMDVAMPQLNGIEATRRILQEASATRIVIFTLLVTEIILAQALAAGAAGIVDKLEGGEFIIPAVAAVAAQQSYFSPKVARVLARLSRGGQRMPSPAHAVSVPPLAPQPTVARAKLMRDVRGQPSA